MFALLAQHQAASTQLVWLKGKKGFVYTEAQPSGLCSVVNGMTMCPMSGSSYTAANGTKPTTFQVPDRPFTPRPFVAAAPVVAPVFVG